MNIKFWTDNLKERGHLGVLRRRLKDNIKMYITAIGGKFVDWIHLVEDRD
jgi:hypothetical protein